MGSGSFLLKRFKMFQSDANSAFVRRSKEKVFHVAERWRAEMKPDYSAEVFVEESQLS